MPLYHLSDEANLEWTVVCVLELYLWKLFGFPRMNYFFLLINSFSFLSLSLFLFLSLLSFWYLLSIATNENVLYVTLNIIKYYYQWKCTVLNITVTTYGHVPYLPWLSIATYKKCSTNATKYYHAWQCTVFNTTVSLYMVRYADPLRFTPSAINNPLYV